MRVEVDDAGWELGRPFYLHNAFSANSLLARMNIEPWQWHSEHFNIWSVLFVAVFSSWKSWTNEPAPPATSATSPASASNRAVRNAERWPLSDQGCYQCCFSDALSLSPSDSGSAISLSLERTVAAQCAVGSIAINVSLWRYHRLHSDCLHPCFPRTP